jgi:DNA topoisomerase-2
MSTKKQIYTKKDPIDHILFRPDMYVGSITNKKVQDYVVINDKYNIEKKTITISPAIIRIFIEPMANILDNCARSKQNKNKVTKICIDIDEKTGLTSLWNDGNVISIDLHEEEKCYNHSLIFGQLLTSSNYDDTEDREDISGRNGLGVKLTNVYSKEFTVEGLDPENKKIFKQTWRNNMKNVEDPIIKTTSLKKGFTKISYIPDFSQFGIDGYTGDILSLYKKYVVDMSMITKIPVFFNNEEIPIKSLLDYSKLFPQISTFQNEKEEIEEEEKEEIEEEEEKEENSDEDEIKKQRTLQTLYIKTSDCEVLITESTEFETISFANGIFTPLGGSHVDPWCETICRPIVEKLNKPKKPQININDVKRFLRIFVVATVKKPTFDSQSKLKLETPEVVPQIKKTEVKQLFKLSFIDKIEEIIRMKELVVLKKVERKKRGYEKVEGLEPANNEGTSKSKDCSLILVEGLSAKTYASQGIQKGAFGKEGRDWFGIYALRGKLLNCRNAKPLKISKNKVVTDIIKALGIQFDLDYTIEENYEKLRYGRVLIITDADTDGIHICGLIQNIFHFLFPSLLKRKESYLTSMQTLIVRVIGKPDILFYDESEYKDYVKNNEGESINKKYYKGLGSSSGSDVLETFGQKIVNFIDDEKCTESMNKAFNNKFSSFRKKWLEKFDSKNRTMKWDGNKKETLNVNISNYIDNELIKFSIDDCRRSIPNIMDGFKESHRKVMYVCFLRNFKYSGKTIKVAQLAGSVAEKSGYHHGEQNLFNTITGMANCYPGSNNIPLLFRDGQFGSRSEGGKDAANARYILTKLDYLTRLIYRKEDDCLLEHVEDDGEKVEPKFYVPILPMILINGCIAGIGTGWSCMIPNFNPKDIIECIKIWLKNGNKAYEIEGDMIISLFPEIKPWYRGYQGEITKEDETKFVSWGKIEQDKNNCVKVKELPIGLWISDFVKKLETMKENKEIKSYKNYSTPNVANFIIKQNDEESVCDEKNLKLFKYIRTSNMVLFSEKGTLKKYDNVHEIIDAYCNVRFSYYQKRKERNIGDIKNKIKFLGNKKRFLEEVIDGKINLFEIVDGKRRSRKSIDIFIELEKKGYDKNLEKEEKGEKEDEDEQEEKKKDKKGYDYLLKLQIGSITTEKINKLKNDIDSCIKELETVEKITESEIWIRELDEFEKEYDKWIVDITKSEEKENKKKKV